MVLALLAGCGGASHPDPDPADYLAVGVDPATEAHTLQTVLAADGYRVTREVTGDAWFAFSMTRSDGASVARLVTHDGVVVALDEVPMALVPARGVLGVEPTPPSGTDLDRDGTIDVVLSREERDRRCWLVARLDGEGGARPLVVDTANLAPDLCLEDLRDVDGNGVPEAIVRVRARALARGATPVADLPLERDATGLYRRVDPAERFITFERHARQARIDAARAVPDAEAAYVAAVELALVGFVAGDTSEAQTAAFDEAMAGIVLDIDMLTAVSFARARIAAGRIAE